MGHGNFAHLMPESDESGQDMNYRACRHDAVHLRPERAGGQPSRAVAPEEQLPVPGEPCHSLTIKPLATFELL